MFQIAKNYSDFIGFHVRLQFVALSSLFILSPFVIKMNEALREGLAYTSDIGLPDKLAFIGLASYGLAMFFFIVITGCQFIWRGFSERIGSGIYQIFYVFPCIFCALFFAFELLINAAILWVGFGRVLDVFGVDINEIVVFNSMIWERACVPGSPGCPE